MDELRKDTYDKFIPCISIVGFGDIGEWDEEIFEEIWEEFSEEVYSLPWKTISEEESEVVQNGIKLSMKIMAQAITNLAEKGYDSINDFDLTDEESNMLEQMKVDEMDINSTTNTILKFLIWCKQFMK